MDKKQAFGKNNSRSSYFVILGIMCFAILVVITAAFKNDILRDIYAFSNTIIDIIGLVFLVLLFGFSFSRAGDIKRPAQAFKLLLTLVFATVFFSSLANSMYKMPDRVIMITTFTTLAYAFAGTFYLALWGYQKQFIKRSKMILPVTVALAAATMIYIAFVIINLFVPVTFVITEQGVWDYNVVDIISFIMNCICISILGIATFASGMDLKKKLSFASFLTVPAFIAIMDLLHYVLGWEIFLMSVEHIAMILTLYIIFFNIHIELENEIIRHEEEQIRLQFSAMISQIQPHFVYNSLSVIAALCEEDPKLAEKAATTFSDYLRENIDFADKSAPVTFEDELKHIKTYVWLEQLRFPDKLKVGYDIGCTGFYLPALSVQPLVENAVKHGICKTRQGGTVKISSFEDERFYTVTVSDDGMGFDPSKVNDDGKQHVGIENARFRIREMSDGDLDIESKPGEGTTVTIKLPKRKTDYEDNYRRR